MVNGIKTIFQCRLSLKLVKAPEFEKKPGKYSNEDNSPNTLNDKKIGLVSLFNGISNHVSNLMS